MKFEGKVRSAILSTHACHPYILLEGEPMSLWVVGNPRASCGRRWGGKECICLLLYNLDPTFCRATGNPFGSATCLQQEVAHALNAPVRSLTCESDPTRSGLPFLKVNEQMELNSMPTIAFECATQLSGTG